MHAGQPQEKTTLAEPLGYATSLQKEGRPPANEAYRDRETLIVLHGSTLPSRCILCGDPAAGEPIRMVFTWDASFQITARSTLEMRKKVHLHATCASATASAGTRPGILAAWEPPAACF
jgi:hypothetical protein